MATSETNAEPKAEPEQEWKHESKNATADQIWKTGPSYYSDFGGADGAILRAAKRRSNLMKMIACALETAFIANDARRNSWLPWDPRDITPFHSKSIPRMSISSYFARYVCV